LLLCLLVQQSSRQQSESDEAIRAQLSSLPQSTPSEQAYAALCTQLLESLGQWRARADTERRRAEQANQAAIQAVTKLRDTVASESDALLAQLRQGGSGLGSTAISSCASPHSTILAAQAGSSSVAHQHPSHLSRRVSFNRDVVMVVSPEIGLSGTDGGAGAGAAAAASAPHGHHPAVPRVDEEDDGAAGAGGEGSAAAAAAAAAAATAHELRANKERRLSRTEFNEGAILKAHLPLEQLEKPDMSKLDIANTPAA